MSKKRGRFLVVEGLDGAGTTTQTRELVRRLASQGIAAEATAEPSHGPIGVLIRQILSGRVTGHDGFDRAALALLFAADRLDHVREVVEPLLAAGRWVVSDRYTLSSLAYQGLDLAPAFVAQINGQAPRPDLTLFLDVPPQVSLRRRSSERAARDLFEDLATQRRVARGYQRALRNGASTLGPVEVLDGSASIAAVTDNLFSIVRQRFGLGRSVSRRS